MSRPEARDGQRYPCPAHRGGGLEVGRAADTKGTMSCRIQKKSVCTSIPLSIRMSVHLFDQSHAVAGWLDEGRTDVQTDRRTDRQTNARTDSPCILQDIIPFGSAAQKKGFHSRF